jgi:hypothetical protein
MRSMRSPRSARSCMRRKMRLCFRARSPPRPDGRPPARSCCRRGGWPEDELLGVDMEGNPFSRAMSEAAMVRDVLLYRYEQGGATRNKSCSALQLACGKTVMWRCSPVPATGANNGHRRRRKFSTSISTLVCFSAAAQAKERTFLEAHSCARYDYDRCIGEASR